MKRKILITGIDGFIAKNLGKFLIENGYYVIGIGKRNYESVKNETYFNKYYKIDLLNLDGYKRVIFKDIDSIIHLAAITEYNKINKNPELALKFNLLTTFNLAEIYVNTEAKTFFYPSSGKVYGIPEYLPIDERHPLNPKIFLGRYKYIGEEILKYFYNISGKPFVVFRIFNVYGPGQKKQFLIPKIISQIKNKSIISLSNVNDKRDYVFIYDLLNVFKLVLENELEGFNVFNVGSGHSYSPLKILMIIKKLLKKQVKYKIDKNNLRELEAKDERADIRLLQRKGWQPNLDIYKGLELILKSEGVL